MGSNSRRLVVVGQGYVGLPLAMRAVEVGFEVIGYEIDDHRVTRLSAGDSYVEDISSEELGNAIASGRYRATSDPADIYGFDVAVITVPTPLRDTLPDLSHIESAARTIAAALTPGALVVLESTTYPGTTEELLVPMLHEGSNLDIGTDVLVGYSPERIDPGNAEWTFVNTPKVVSGINPASLSAVDEFYGQLVNETVPVSSPKEAELTKLLENTFRHVNIALVNELAMFAGELGIDVWEAIDAASTKPFGFMRFLPGPGVGGHCLPVDPSYLSWQVRRSLGESFRFVELANDVNAHMPAYVVRRLSRALNERGRAVNGSRVLLLGIGYKRNTSDARESPAITVASELVALGANVRVADPFVQHSVLEGKVTRVECDREELSSADAVLMLTNHDAFDVKAVAEHARYVLDCRRAVPAGDNVEYL
ncbi:MAG TPA: nucleotide sugar dehydrogenase [Acidimicrobiales bacterium]|nr:nucleotide sugar dehydrogenase [Acidimicrobiales bacterium]